MHSDDGIGFAVFELLCCEASFGVQIGSFMIIAYYNFVLKSGPLENV